MMINMKKVNYAAIDIGSNAVRLLIKCVNEENAPELMSKVQLIRIPLRLGEDAFTAGIISAEKEKKLIRLMKASSPRDRKSTRLNSSHESTSRMPSSA